MIPVTPARVIFMMRLRLIASVIAMIPNGPARPVFAQQPPTCALLTAGEVEATAGTKVAGQPGHLAPTDTDYCEYNWTAKSFSPRLQVSVSPASRLWPGVDPATIKNGILGGPRGLPANATAVPDVGDAAAYTQQNEHAASVVAYIKGKILEITYQGTDSPAKKTQIIGLLKSAASRM
jgi:hypothetical protein